MLSVDIAVRVDVDNAAPAPVAADVDERGDSDVGKAIVDDARGDNDSGGGSCWCCATGDVGAVSIALACDDVRGDDADPPPSTS